MHVDSEEGRGLRVPRRVAIIGRGLIGGSFEKAALRAGFCVKCLHHGDSGFEDAEMVIVCLPPDAIVPWVRSKCSSFAKGAVVVDAAGTKAAIMAEMEGVPKDGWTFVGGHPMAGREVSGYENSIANLFDGASMLLVPERDGPVPGFLEPFFKSLGFGRVVVTTADRHDEMIAFTSQLCHVIATAYARDPLVPESQGFTSGSYADMTRIATQDPAIWSELFRENGKALVEVVDRFIARIGEFRAALAAGDRSAIAEIIKSGADAKRAYEYQKGSQL